VRQSIDAAFALPPCGGYDFDMLTTALILAALVLVAAAATALGMRLARVRSHFWLLGFILPLGVILLVILGRRIPTLALWFPISWVVHYRVTQWLMAVAVPILLATLAGRLPRRSQRIAVRALMAVTVVYFCLFPILDPILGQYRLQGHATVIDRDGVCRQTTEFSCGPAAAVTALRSLGIKADESVIAREALTGPAFGTDPVALADAINRLYAASGIHAEYRRFNAESDLTDRTPVIVSIRASSLSDHYITILGMDRADIFIGDPAAVSKGLQAYPRGIIPQMWHNTGIMLTRTPPPPPSLTTAAK